MSCSSDCFSYNDWQAVVKLILHGLGEGGGVKDCVVGGVTVCTETELWKCADLFGKFKSHLKC